MEYFTFINHPFITALIAILSWPIYKEIAKWFFGENYESLAETLHYMFQSDWRSAMKGKYWEDKDASFKFKVFMFFCIGWVCAISEIVCDVIF